MGRRGGKPDSNTSTNTLNIVAPASSTVLRPISPHPQQPESPKSARKEHTDENDIELETTLQELVFDLLGNRVETDVTIGTDFLSHCTSWDFLQKAGVSKVVPPRRQKIRGRQQALSSVLTHAGRGAHLQRQRHNPGQRENIHIQEDCFEGRERRWTRVEGNDTTFRWTTLGTLYLASLDLASKHKHTHRWRANQIAQNLVFWPS